MKLKQAAVEQLAKMTEKEGNKDVRIFTFKNCCSTMIAIDTKTGEPGDKLIKQDSFSVFVEPAAFEMLSDAEIDCEDGEFRITGMKQDNSSCCC